MILGFKDRFIPFIEDGSKTHTIRAGNRWKAGMRADLYAKPRQKGMRLIFRAEVVKVERISIVSLHGSIGISISGIGLTWDEANLLAYRDGFREFRGIQPIDVMARFWRATHELPFTGQIIHWDYHERYIPCRDCGYSHPLGPCAPACRNDCFA